MYFLTRERTSRRRDPSQHVSDQAMALNILSELIVDHAMPFAWDLVKSMLREIPKKLATQVSEIFNETNQHSRRTYSQLFLDKDPKKVKQYLSDEFPLHVITEDNLPTYTVGR